MNSIQVFVLFASSACFTVLIIDLVPCGSVCFRGYNVFLRWLLVNPGRGFYNDHPNTTGKKNEDP